MAWPPPNPKPELGEHRWFYRQSILNARRLYFCDRCGEEIVVMLTELIEDPSFEERIDARRDCPGEPQ